MAIMNDENGQGRRVKVTLEVDLIEGEHFATLSYGPEKVEGFERGSDEDIKLWAKNYFLNDFLIYTDNLEEFVQVRVIE